MLRNLLISITCLLNLLISVDVYAQHDNELFNIELSKLTGESTTLAGFVSNKPVYLKFWASYCQPCREQMPHFQHVHQDYADSIDIISINLGRNEPIPTVVETIESFGLTMPTLIDGTGKLAQALDLRGTPYHVLIDTQGNIVFKGHDVTTQLDNTIKLLSASNSAVLPTVLIGEQLEKQSLVSNQKGFSLLFFTATWCDWYLAERRPNIANNCIAGQQQANALYQQWPELNWLGVTSRLWTGDKELAEYKNKYQIAYPLAVDVSDQTFIDYQVQDFPTLLLIKEGQVLYRISDFSNQQAVIEAIAKHLN